MTTEDLCFLPATSLADAIRRRELSPVEIVRAVFDRIDTVNPAINAFCTVARDRALAEAREREAEAGRGDIRGPLHGVPVSFKDTTETAGIRTTYGSRIFEHNVPSEDAIVVERARRAGAIVIGKTNTPEFACKGTTDNRLFGVTRNPWDPGRIAGGSSGGAAAAVAAGLGPLAEGTDLAGSIRIPASCCGVVGLKPTIGRVPAWPAANGWTGFSVHGPLTRTVADAALLLSVLAGPDERDPQSVPAAVVPSEIGEPAVRGLRIGWSADLGYARVDAEVRAAVASAVSALGEEGAKIQEAPPDFEDPKAVFVVLSAVWRWGVCGAYLPEWRDRMDPVLVERLGRVEGLDARAYEAAVQARTRLWHVMRRFFERHDVLVSPTTAVAAFPLDSDFPPEIAGRRLESQLDWYPFTYPFNLTGHPAVSVPCGWTRNGLPVGLQIVGPRFAEPLVLRVAAAVEAIRPWRHRRPSPVLVPAGVIPGPLPLRG